MLACPATKNRVRERRRLLLHHRGWKWMGRDSGGGGRSRRRRRKRTRLTDASSSYPIPSLPRAHKKLPLYFLPLFSPTRFFFLIPRFESFFQSFQHKTSPSLDPQFIAPWKVLLDQQQYLLPMYVVSISSSPYFCFPICPPPPGLIKSCCKTAPQFIAPMRSVKKCSG